MFDEVSNIDLKIKKLQKIDFISLHRDSLMGIAILWVVFLHSGIDFGKSGLISYFLSFIKYSGYLGVDIFFFVSGFGLMVGRIKKKYTLISFYKRRFLRIMPMFWFFLSLTLILFGITKNFISTLFDYTGFSYLIFKNSHWFINAIILCYLMYPFFAKNFEESKNKIKILTITLIFWLCLAIILTASACIFADKFSYLLVIILRMPAFLIGSFIGYIYVKKDTSYNYLFSIYFHFFFVVFCYMALALIFYFSTPEVRDKYGLYWYPFVLGSFSLTYLLSIFFHMLSKHFGYLLVILDKIGKSSLELYFIHFLVFDHIIRTPFIFNYLDISLEGNYLWFVGIFTSVLFAILFNSVWSNLIKIKL